VAVSVSVRALQHTECDLALAAGVNLMLLPSLGLIFAAASMTSVRGRSHTFDSRADGYVRAEACGALVLRGVPGWLSVQGSAVRQDGKSASLTAPNGHAQELLLCAALSSAGVKASMIARLELHGTGTKLGDPVEAGGLASAMLGSNREHVQSPAAGSIKANSGHAEPAAGMTGLVLIAESLEHRRAPPFAQL
jgi:acyl transferase domain-containing protein